MDRRRRLGHWEEINRVADPRRHRASNFGWPCYEGDRPPGAATTAPNLNLCENLYAPGERDVVSALLTPTATAAQVVAGESCPTGSSSIAGMAFYDDAADFPDAYDGALFFSDYSRDCIWVMPPGANGLPNPATVQTFVAGRGNPVDLEVGPDGDLFYPDFTAARSTGWGHSRQPTARLRSPTADPTSGPAPLDRAVRRGRVGVIPKAWKRQPRLGRPTATGNTTTRRGRHLSRTYPAGPTPRRSGSPTPAAPPNRLGDDQGRQHAAGGHDHGRPPPLTWGVGQQVDFAATATDPQQTCPRQRSRGSSTSSTAGRLPHPRRAGVRRA